VGREGEGLLIFLSVRGVGCRCRCVWVLIVGGVLRETGHGSDGGGELGARWRRQRGGGRTKRG
jgi:hypothetical protein